MDKIIIEIRRGVVQNITSTSEMDIYIIDYDNEEMGGRIDKNNYPPNQVLEKLNFYEYLDSL